MTLKETLRTDLTAAMKARDELKVSTLRLLLGAVQSAEKVGKVEVLFNDTAVEKMIRSQAKQRRESAIAFAEANLPERADRELAEAAILDAYLPEELTEEEVSVFIDEAVASFDIPLTQKHLGLLMGPLTTRIKGRFDGRRLLDLVKERLN